MQVTTSLSASLSSTREPGGSSGSPQSEESETKNIKVFYNDESYKVFRMSGHIISVLTILLGNLLLASL